MRGEIISKTKVWRYVVCAEEFNDVCAEEFNEDQWVMLKSSEHWLKVETSIDEENIDADWATVDGG